MEWAGVGGGGMVGVVVVVTTPRSGSFPYFRTVRGVLPANAVTQIHHSRRPCPDPLLPTLPPFQPSPLASYLLEFTRQPLLESHCMIENSNSPNAGLELVTQRTKSHVTSEQISPPPPF